MWRAYKRCDGHEWLGATPRVATTSALAGLATSAQPPDRSEILPQLEDAARILARVAFATPKHAKRLRAQPNRLETDKGSKKIVKGCFVKY